MSEMDPLRVAMGRKDIATIADLAKVAGVGHATINRVMFEADTGVHLGTVLKIGKALGLSFDDANALVTEMRERVRKGAKA